VTDPAGEVPPDELVSRVAAARRACLATLGKGGEPHLVPVTFVVLDARIYLVVDAKPKRGPVLQRTRNIGRDPRVCLLVDHYVEDWTELWWFRLDGTAVLEEDPGTRARAVQAFAAKYFQYADRPPNGAVISIVVSRVVTWSAAGGSAVSLRWPPSA
jgi:PPOX class probable F420-dependent enzyme